MLLRPLSSTSSSRPLPSSVTRTTISSPAETRTSTADASACRVALLRASPRTASRSGATVAPTRERTGPSMRTVGWNFMVAAARSTIRSISVCTSVVASMVPKREDRAPDVLDGAVELVDRALEPSGDLGRHGHPRRALEAETDREEPLDDQVVQVAADAVPVLQQRRAAAGPRATGRSGERAPPARRSSPAGPRRRRRTRPRCRPSRRGRARPPRRCATRAAPRWPGRGCGQPKVEEGSTARGSAARSRTAIASPLRTTCAASDWCIGRSRIAARSAATPETTRSSRRLAVGADHHPRDVGPGDLAGPVRHQLEGVRGPGSASERSAVISAVARSQSWRRSACS